MSFDRDAATRGPTVEVAHEALLREWPRLRGWLRESRSEVRLQRQVAQAAAEWEAAHREPGLLLTGTRLAQIEAWQREATVTLTASEHALLDASLDERERRAKAEAARAAREIATERRARRTLQALVVVFLAAAVVAAGLAWWANDQRQAAVTNLAQSEAQRLAAEANRLFIEQRDYETAALLALKALDLGYSPQGDEALSRAARETYAARLFLGHSANVIGIAFSADGRRVVSADERTAPLVWDVATGTILTRIEDFAKGASTIDLSSDGQYVAAGGGDTVCVWHANTGQEVYCQAFGNTLTSVDISADGRFLLVAGWDKMVHVLDFASGDELRRLTQPDSLLGARFSPDARLVLTGDVNGRVWLWDWQANATVQELTVVGWPWGLAFAPDMSTFGVASYDKVAYIFETASGKLLHEIPHEDELLYALEYSLDGRYMTTSDQRGVVHLWDVSTGQEARRFLHRADAFASAFTPDRRYLVTGLDDGTISFWDLQARPVQIEIPGAGHTEGALAFTNDGEGLFAMGRVFDSRTGDPGPDTGVFGASHLSLDGETALVVSADPFVIHIFDTRTWAARLAQPVNCLQEQYGQALSPDGSLVAVASFDFPYKICVYDSRSGEVVQVLDTSSITYGLAFSADNRTLVAAECSDIARIYDLATGSVVRSLQKTDEPMCTMDLAISPDGTLIVTARYNGDVDLWDYSTGKLIRSFVGHSDAVRGVAFSPDGQTVLTGSADGTARLLDVSTGAEVRRFSGHTATVWRPAFSPDGRRVATSSSDGTVKLWYTDLNELKDAVCNALPRDLTDKERERYGILDSAPTCDKFAAH